MTMMKVGYHDEQRLVGGKVFDVPQRGEAGWRAEKGPQGSNESGLRATGHRLLLATMEVEEVSPGGIIYAKKTVDKEKTAAVVCRVVEIGHDCWRDKVADFCQVGDRVLVGMYTGKFHTSEKDGKEYRFVADLDIISPLED
jgi:co-chaperonin GroES (HSP10)